MKRKEIDSVYQYIASTNPGYFVTGHEMRKVLDDYCLIRLFADPSAYERDKFVIRILCETLYLATSKDGPEWAFRQLYPHTKEGTLGFGLDPASFQDMGKQIKKYTTWVGRKYRGIAAMSRETTRLPRLADQSYGNIVECIGGACVIMNKPTKARRHYQSIADWLLACFEQSDSIDKKHYVSVRDAGLEMQEMADRISKSPKAAKAFLIKRVRTRLKEYGLPMPGRRKRSGTRKPSAQRAKR